MNSDDFLYGLHLYWRQFSWLKPLLVLKVVSLKVQSIRKWAIIAIVLKQNRKHEYKIKMSMDRSIDKYKIKMSMDRSIDNLYFQATLH